MAAFWALMRTETPVLNKEICCWMYTMNPSERHLPMAMRVLLEMFAMCLEMAPPERRECVLASFGANPSLAATTRLDSALRMVMVMEALTEQRP